MVALLGLGGSWQWASVRLVSCCGYVRDIRSKRWVAQGCVLPGCLPREIVSSALTKECARIATHSCSRGAQQKSTLQRSGRHCRTCSTRDEKERTLRLNDESVWFHRQHNRSQMRRLLSSIPGQSSGICEVACLLHRIVTIPQRWWLACLVARMGVRLLILATWDVFFYQGLRCMTSIRQAAGCMDLVRLGDAS